MSTSQLCPVRDPRLRIGGKHLPRSVEAARPRPWRSVRRHSSYNNAITDVKGVEVGHTTLISGGRQTGNRRRPSCTGVTADADPHGKAGNDASLRRMVHTEWQRRNDWHYVGRRFRISEWPCHDHQHPQRGCVRNANSWKVKHGTPDMEGYWWSLPVVAETWDGYLNDIDGFHVKPEDAFHALDTAHSGPVEEGNVGGGTGADLQRIQGGNRNQFARSRFKGRRLHHRSTRAVQLRIARTAPHCRRQCRPRDSRTYRLERGRGSLSSFSPPTPPHPRATIYNASPPQKISLGLGRDGSYSGDGSGDIFIAFSTANPGAVGTKGLHQLTMLPNDALDPIFLATVQATEEAVVNAMVAAETMTGIDRRRHCSSTRPSARSPLEIQPPNKIDRPEISDSRPFAIEPTRWRGWGATSVGPCSTWQGYRCPNMPFPRRKFCSSIPCLFSID